MRILLFSSLLTLILLGKNLTSSKEIKLYQPYMGINFNNVLVTADDKTYSFTAYGYDIGLLILDEHKIDISYYNQDPIYSFKINYDYSYNNFGTHRGFTLGGGLNRSMIKKMVTSVDSNGTKTSEMQEFNSNSLTLGVGFEYKLNKSYIIDMHGDINLIGNREKKNVRERVNGKISIRYVFE